MSKNRSFLLDASRTPEQKVFHLDPNVARQSPILFGFKHLTLDKKPFECTAKNIEGILYILNTFRLFSQIIRSSLEISYPNCHVVPTDQVHKHNLGDFLNFAPNKRLHQLGRGRTPERIVGYFDSPSSNLFQVCLFDLKHNLSGN